MTRTALRSAVVVFSAFAQHSTSFVLRGSRGAAPGAFTQHPRGQHPSNAPMALGLTNRIGSTAAVGVRATSMASSSTDETPPVSPLPGNCLVIGGNRGLGLEVVRHLKKRESTILATTRTTNADLEAVGVSVLEGIDVSDKDSGTKLVEAVQKELGEGGTLDYVICNVGILIPDTFEDPKFDAAVKMYEVCVLGPLRVLQALVLSGLLREGSSIGMVTSEGGSVGLRTEVEGGNNYGHHMSKCAQNMMGKLFALDVKPRGVAIVNIHPGFMKTSMTEIYADKYDELGAIGPEEAAPGIVKAVEDLTLENTGKFIAPKGSTSLGLGVYALEDPESYGPFSELPW
ncbi:unnamed protein product [Ectocarpus sp. 12 AP-2014]